MVGVYAKPEAAGQCVGTQGGVIHLLAHSNCCGGFRHRVDVLETDSHIKAIFYVAADGGIVPGGSNAFNFKLTGHLIHNLHSEAVNSLVVRHAGQRRIRLYLYNAVVVGANSGIMLVVDFCREAEHLFGIRAQNSLFCQGNPLVIGQIQPLQPESEAVGGFPTPVTGEGLCACNTDIDRMDFMGLVAVNYHNRGKLVCFNGHLAVTQQAVIPIGSGEALVRFRIQGFCNHSLCTCRQASDCNALIVLQRQCELTVFICSNGAVVEASFCQRFAVQTQSHSNLEGSVRVRQLIVRAKGMLDFLGNGQAAGPSDGIGKDNRGDGLVLGGYRIAGEAGGTCQNVFFRQAFRNLQLDAGGQAHNGDALPCLQGNLSPVVCKGHLGQGCIHRAVSQILLGGIIAVGYLSPCNGKGEGGAVCIGAFKGLCQADAGGGNDAQAAVVAHSDTEYEAVVQIVHGIAFNIGKGAVGNV